MSVSLVLTVVGQDRPGLVEALSQVVARHEGNWLESRMARLGGQFAGVLRVSLPAAQREALEVALGKLAAQGLAVAVTPADAQPKAPSQTFGLELTGSDRPGIVREIAQALARHSVNVEELETELASAPMSGETLFRARAQLSFAGGSGAALDAMREDLERIADDLMVDLSLAADTSE